MKRLRISRCTGQLLNAQARTHASPSLTPISVRSSQQLVHNARSSTCGARSLFSWTRPSATEEEKEVEVPEEAPEEAPEQELKPLSFPSPLPEKALSSAKLAALHARLSLPEKVPLQTLARCLVDPSADPSPNFNNVNLAVVGASLINYHTSERLVCQYPRLPMTILFEAMRAYAGSDSLYRIAHGWGVENTIHPGDEVDPGLLQWSQELPTVGITGAWGYERKEAHHLDKFKWRRGVSSRVVLDDEFGDTVHTKRVEAPKEPKSSSPEEFLEDPTIVRERWIRIRNNAHAAFVRAVTGAIYAHCGRDAVRSFVDAHVLSRKVDLERLFSFKLPTRELAMLCAREGFEPPVARLESETGRLSRTPVYVVGIYSGRDKLGEGTGASLTNARLQASMNALKSWYLYSPGNNVRVPSDMLVEGAKPWQPVHIDMGEII
ncbi:54S ribosomal protein L3 [Colletotrichum siamense]|uniref:54S ribosomal protein L3 n=1 Tax=Colletotrichum siamense TaxID=690259 RepID=UPI001872981D|nr:54S ribosomal protein L3 [Colletotrichum siamense]KAF5497722.1 54S ribosomal protein L3 [Colletotrichum siamense]